VGLGADVGVSGVAVGLGADVAVSAGVNVLVSVEDDVTVGVGERDGVTVGRTGVGVLVGTEASMSRQSPGGGGARFR